MFEKISKVECCKLSCDNTAPCNRPQSDIIFQGYTKQTHTSVEKIRSREMNYKWNCLILQQHCCYAKKNIRVFMHQCIHVYCYYLWNLINIFLWKSIIKYNIKIEYHNKRYINKYLISIVGDMLVRLYKVFFQYIKSKYFIRGTILTFKAKDDDTIFQ